MLSCCECCSLMITEAGEKQSRATTSAFLGRQCWTLLLLKWRGSDYLLLLSRCGWPKECRWGVDSKKLLTLVIYKCLPVLTDNELDMSPKQLLRLDFAFVVASTRALSGGTGEEIKGACSVLRRHTAPYLSLSLSQLVAITPETAATGDQPKNPCGSNDSWRWNFFLYSRWIKGKPRQVPPVLRPIHHHNSTSVQQQ